MLSAFAKAARVLGRSDYLQITENNANFIAPFEKGGVRGIFRILRDDFDVALPYPRRWFRDICNRLRVRGTPFKGALNGQWSNDN